MDGSKAGYVLGGIIGVILFIIIPFATHGCSGASESKRECWKCGAAVEDTYIVDEHGVTWCERCY